MEVLQNGVVKVKKGRGITKERALLECLLTEIYEELEDFSTNYGGNERDDEIFDDANDTEIKNSNKTIAPCEEKRSKDKGKMGSTTHRKEHHIHQRRGLNGLSQAYQNMEKISGGMDEDLLNHFEVCSAMSRTCELTEDEKCKGLSFTLKGQALRYYIQNFKDDDSYKTIRNKLLAYYFNEEHQKRKLIMWQSLHLSDMFSQNADKSELEVFTSLVDKLISIQGQLSVEYQSDNILRDELMRSTYLPRITQPLRERIPATSLDARNRIATFLSAELNSAGAFATIETEMYQSEEVNYTVGAKLEGEAVRRLKGGESGFQKHRRISSKWIRVLRAVMFLVEIIRPEHEIQRKKLERLWKKLRTKIHLHIFL